MEVANDRIARRARDLARRRRQEQRRQEMSPEAGMKAARAWLANGPVKAGARFRPTRADREALIGERAA